MWYCPNNQNRVNEMPSFCSHQSISGTKTERKASFLLETAFQRQIIAWNFPWENTKFIADCAIILKMVNANECTAPRWVFNGYCFTSNASGLCLCRLLHQMLSVYLFNDWAKHLFGWYRSFYNIISFAVI